MGPHPKSSKHGISGAAPFVIVTGEVIVMGDPTASSPIAQRLLAMVAAINGGETDPLSRYVGEGLIIRDVHSGLPAGRAGLKLRLGLWEAALPDLTLTIGDLTVTGDEAAMTLTAVGTHLGELFEVVGTGERVTFRATVRTRWAAGLLAEWDCSCHGPSAATREHG
jgi:predicted ester cyclase